MRVAFGWVDVREHALETENEYELILVAALGRDVIPLAISSQRQSTPSQRPVNGASQRCPFSYASVCRSDKKTY